MGDEFGRKAAYVALYVTEDLKWVAVDRRAMLGVATFDVGGYTPVFEFFATREDAETEAKRRNAGMGLSEREASVITISSMALEAGEQRNGRSLDEVVAELEGKKIGHLHQNQREHAFDPEE